MAFTFQKATKHQARARLAFVGPSGSGKTYTALAIAAGLGGLVGVIDTERGSASKYAGIFHFEVGELETFSPDAYVKAIAAAADAGIKVLIIDSLSHAWMGKGGALEMVDNAAKRSQSKNSFQAWRDVTPQHNALVDAILSAPMHVIATMRAKTEYVMEKDERTGKTVPRKIGIQPVQRDGMEYEFDVVADMTMDNEMIVGKTRCPELAGRSFSKPGADVAKILSAWLTDGVPEVERRAPAPAPEQAPSPAADDGYVARSREIVTTIKEALAVAPTDPELVVASKPAKAALSLGTITKEQFEYLGRVFVERRKALAAKPPAEPAAPSVASSPNIPGIVSPVAPTPASPTPAPAAGAA